MGFVEGYDDSQLALEGAIVLKVGNSLYDRVSTPNPDGNVVQRGGDAGHNAARGRSDFHSHVSDGIVPN